MRALLVGYILAGSTQITPTYRLNKVLQQNATKGSFAVFGQKRIWEQFGELMLPGWKVGGGRERREWKKGKKETKQLRSGSTPPSVDGSW